MQFDHEKLDVYKVSLEFSAYVSDMLDELKGWHPHLKDQIARASLSIPLNIAEGNGKRSPNDRRHFFVIARGSAMECAAVLDVIRTYRIRNSDEINKGKALLFRIVSMLSRMTESYDGVRENPAVYGDREGAGVDYDHEHEHEHEEKHDCVRKDPAVYGDREGIGIDYEHEHEHENMHDNKHE